MRNAHGRLKAIKRAEVILPEGETDKLIQAIEGTGISGDALIHPVCSSGDRGRTLNVVVQLDNDYLLMACEHERPHRVAETIRPFLRKYRGSGLAS